MMMRNISALALVVLLASCSPAQKPAPEAPEQGAETTAYIAPSTDDLNEFFDCLEAENVTLISAHRGGAYPGYPENALETMRYVGAEVPSVMEIDVNTSSDGVLFLLHDDTLDRTTTGTGMAQGLSWAELKELYLIDNDGGTTSFHLPKFADVLEWAEDKALLQIDFKKSTRFEDVIDEVKRQGATSRIIYITYTMGQARRLHKLHPEAMISVTLDDVADLDDLKEAQIPMSSVLGWTGNTAPQGQVFRALNDRDIEVIFGTLGGRNSIDEQILDENDEKRYAEIAAMGVDIIGTDRPFEAFDSLVANGRPVFAPKCGVGG